MVTDVAPTISHRWPELTFKAVLDGCNSQNTRRAYSRALNGFFDWLGRYAKTITREAVIEYKAYLQDDKALAPQSVNVHLAAIRALVTEAAAMGMITLPVAETIKSVKGDKAKGQRLGNWLSLQQAMRMIGGVDGDLLIGKRDRAALAMLLGGALRREELADLKREQYVLRNGRGVLLNVLGKGRKLRSVALPSWCGAMVDEWIDAAAITDGPLLRKVYRDVVKPEGISTKAVYRLVRIAGERIGMGNIGPHDLRRTSALLAYKGGAKMRQIQAQLGHASQLTTEKYLGPILDLEEPACDFIGAPPRKGKR